ncbi:hypothetical protein OE88DRAFT_1640726 [Heliocybe sulcata]|uniref:Uncharacterized protein n=1 Tax=Heliocybe sulcata TaxID=5364 RepID=A0A5C3NJ48_9AGAM|nr:hypothetical protein OE88DRAFT_1640726 [Heliocybe sulcata]
MPSRRSRSRSVSRELRRSKSPDSRSRLPDGVDEITESDYFLKSAEFRVWLKDEKGKYFDQLSGEKARSYFRKFVKAWNRGKVSKSLYRGVDQASQHSTAYKWSFASKTDRKEREAIEAVRREIGESNYSRESQQNSGSGPGGSGRRQGPTLPSREDLILAREAGDESQAAERQYKRKRDREEAKERIEDMVGPKEVGREGMLEKKRAKRESDRAFREKGDDGFVEADESTLMGGGDSFRERIAQRDAARKRFAEKRQSHRDERVSEVQERRSALREKDKSTMDMFMKMAQERFG